MATTAEAVLGGEQEFEGVAGMSAVAMRLPGVVVTPWVSTPQAPIPLGAPGEVSARIRLTHDFRCAIMVGDPFSTPIARLLPALSSCGGKQPVPIVGGMASGASQPGCNVLVLDDRVFPAGAIGVSLAGDIEVDVVVSQGCRPIGSPSVVTKVQGNLVLELGGRPALDVLRELTEGLEESERSLLNRGLLLGTVIDEHKRPFGRGDFLVRNVLGFDRSRDALVVGDVPRRGQTVQFHARDAVTAAEDLQLLLDAQQLKEPPFAGLLFSCNSRGERLFGEPNHDVSVIRERLGPLALAGFFAAGEIGPVGEQSFLHGHTAAFAILRSPSRE
jgi:small ligand-binding sensory domain FIST